MVLACGAALDDEASGVPGGPEVTSLFVLAEVPPASGGAAIAIGVQL